MPRSYSWPRRKASVKNVMNLDHCHKAGNAIAAGLSAAGGNDLQLRSMKEQTRNVPWIGHIARVVAIEYSSSSLSKPN